ncbi:MAG TPA: TonB-dependent receptor [Acidobacteriota bacterium]|nr:TonB-dependent receptor [Acidobacteriota bacterium]
MDAPKRSPGVCLFFVLLFAALSFSSISFAQIETGTISGEVKDEDGQPLPGAFVTITGVSGVKSATSDAEGKFEVSGLTPGVYKIKVELSGFASVEQSEVQVAAGPAQMSFSLVPGGLQETMVVSASRIETPLVNAPATMSVLSSTQIENSPAENYGDLIRSVPGVNVIQTSARDINITSRQATTTLATSQLALLDGRTIYQDFFGFVLWDFLPVNFNEIKQIEVIRGPASAVWGANAQTGVVNIITKSPREIAGTSLTFSAGIFDRDVEGGEDLDSGTSYGASVTHAQALNDSWSFKISAGYFDSDPFARPAGVIPASTVPNTNIPTGGFPYSAVNYVNNGTSQPKFDVRFDQELSEDSRIIYAGGIAGTEGIIHTGIGPFDIQSGSKLGYGKVNYTNGNFRLNFFTNILDGDAQNLLTRGIDGNPIEFLFDTQTYDFEGGHTFLFGENNVLTLGGNYRRNNFDLSLAPLGNDRNEAGFYIQDEIFTDHFRFVVGGRVDYFDVIEGAVFSPRLTFMYKPTPEHTMRASYNRAFRAPSLVNNFLDVTIITAVDLRPLAPIPQFPVITRAIGNENLQEEQLDAYEVGYTGDFGGRTVVSLSYYVNDTDQNINFVPAEFYSPTNPPPGWPLPPIVLALLAQQGIFFPSTFTYLNLGPIRNQGFEASIDQVINDHISVYANYSYQKDPEILEDADGTFPPGELGFPPNNRFNAGFAYNDPRFLGSVSLNYADSAFWTDVLDARFWGETDAYTMVNGSFGVKWLEGRLTTTLKVTNIFNEEIQQHIFGDVLKRNITGEVRIDF